ncbi:cupin domain-containing protein [Pseudoclavibacter albus]|uniref:hypothetical protein n=1 Tax=Pseudoclavibacter albus TaxID=272241 RepID=UPI000825C9DA|nr:hypothetical protein [Pseudoclavibacter alba]
MATSHIDFESASFRITTWTIEPGDAIEFHVHEHDYVVIPREGSEMHVIREDDSELVATMSPDAPYERAKGSSHRVENRGSERIIFTEIEHLGQPIPAE